MDFQTDGIDLIQENDLYCAHDLGIAPDELKVDSNRNTKSKNNDYNL